MIKCKSPRLLFFLLLLGQVNCSDCTEGKPTPSSWPQPTPIQGIPDIPPAPENPIPNPNTPPSPNTLPNPDSPENPTEDDNTCSIIITYVDKSQQKYIEDDIKWLKEWYEERNINPSITKNNNQIVLHIPIFDALKLGDLTLMFFYMVCVRAINFVKFPKLYPTKTNLMFQRCINLTSLKLPDMDYSNLEDCMNMFYGCSCLNLEGTNLTKQDISAFDNRLSQLNPNDKLNVFYNCPLGKHFNNI